MTQAEHFNYCERHASETFVRVEGKTVALAKLPPAERAAFINLWWRQRQARAEANVEPA